MKGNPTTKCKSTSFIRFWSKEYVGDSINQSPFDHQRNVLNIGVPIVPSWPRVFGHFFVGC